MKAQVKPRKNKKKKGPVEVVSEGSVSVPIYATINRIYRKDPQTGERELKSQHPQYTLCYYEGTRRVLRKFATLEAARKEAGFVVIRLANGDTEALKLNGGDRIDYVRSLKKLHEWNPNADLYTCVCDYVAARRLLPEDVSAKESAESFRKRHPIGLPAKTVREVVDELVESKTNAGKSDVYTEDLDQRLGKFADTFQVRISSVAGKQIEEYIRRLGKSGRTQNNVRRLLNTLFKFAIKRGYLPKDHDEMSGVEKAAEIAGEIEVFTPAELRRLFDACTAPVKERGKWRTREEMIPYLAIAAFCGLRAAEIQRLDWSEVHLTGSERFIEVKASKAKTASRRTVPISDNCAAWLLPYAKDSGPVVKLARTDKQLFIYLAVKSGVPWKHNGLRHSFISYRLAIVKDVGKVSLEAGNSPGMVFKHYRQLVRESEANEWFAIIPSKQDGAQIIPMPSTERPAQPSEPAPDPTVVAASSLA